MRKFDERHDPGSCFNKALEGEVVFVLLARDAAAPAAIEAWAQTRIALGLNVDSDKKIEDAHKCAREMARQRTAQDFT